MVLGRARERAEGRLQYLEPYETREYEIEIGVLDGESELAAFDVKEWYHTAMKPDDFVPVSLEPDPVIEAYKKDIDITLLIENLKLTPEQRLRKLMELQKFAEEIRKAGQAVQEGFGNDTDGTDPTGNDQ